MGNRTGLATQNRDTIGRDNMTTTADTQGTLPPQVQQIMQTRMQDPAFMQWFQSLTPEQQQQAIQRLSMDYSGAGAVADDQMAMAAALRNTPTAEGRQAGRVYVAANPLEHIGSAYKQRQGMRQYDEAVQRKKELSDMQSQGLGDVMGALLRGEKKTDDNY